MYRCLNCGKEIEDADLKRVRCPFCGYRILLKKRPTTRVKKVEAL